MTSKSLISWSCQIVAAAILFPAAWYKLTSNPMAISTFTALDMEPAGRYMLGVLELLAAGLIITRSFAAHGALLGFGIMLGAAIAHVSILGFSVNNDGGLLVYQLGALVISCIIIMIIRKEEIPFFGNVFED